MKTSQFVLTTLCAAVLAACSSSGNGQSPFTHHMSNVNQQASYESAQQTALSAYQAAQTAVNNAVANHNSSSIEANNSESSLKAAQTSVNQAVTTVAKQTAVQQATQAKNAADHALNKANSALSQATTAQTQANNALKSAQAAVTAAKTEADKQAANELVANAEKLVTQAQINQQNAQSLQARATQNHQQALALQAQAAQNYALAQNADNTAKTAEQKANDALNAAKTAVNTSSSNLKTATEAKTSSDNAQKSAETAKTTAATAIQAATTTAAKKDASDKAANAKTAADNAVKTAETAKAEADKAVTAAQTAKAEADKAVAAATNTTKAEAQQLQAQAAEQLKQAQAAQTAAQSQLTASQSAAATAATTAATALTAYNNAVNQDNANKTAEQKANDALNAAKTAVNTSSSNLKTATEAKTSSDNAQKSAETAKTTAATAIQAATTTAAKKDASDKAANAKTAADNAVKTAETAKAEADKAVTAAQTAKAEADKAVAAATNATKAEAQQLQTQAAEQLKQAQAAQTAAQSQLTASQSAATTAATTAATALATYQAAVKADDANKLVEKAFQDKVAGLLKDGEQKAVFTQQEVDTSLVKEFGTKHALFPVYSYTYTTFLNTVTTTSDLTTGKNLYRPDHYEANYYGASGFSHSSGQYDVGVLGKSHHTSAGIYTGPLSPKNLLGIKIHTKDGEQYSQGTLPYILNKTASKFELASIKGNNRYTQWFTNFNANADSKDLNKMRSISSVDIARDSNYEPLLDAKKKIQYELTAKDNATELVENNSSSNSPVEMNTNGELVSVITFEKPTVFTLDSNKTSNFKEIAAKLGWEMGKEYRFEPGKYLLIQGSNNKLRFEQDTGQYTQLNTIYTAIADELPESGAFDNKRVVAEVFSTSNMGKVNEKRAIHAYDVGHANGYNQAYLSLNAWKFKDNEGKYDGSPYNLTIYNNLGFTPYNNPIGLPDGLKATYKGVAYSDRTGKQDGVLNMTAEFGKQDGYYSRQELTFNGSITGRTQNDGRDVYFASGNVKTNSGMPSSNAGTTIYTNDTIKNMTVWMEGKHAEEAKVIYGEGRLRFGGFAAEEVGGILTIKPKDGEENIGFIGKR